MFIVYTYLMTNFLSIGLLVLASQRAETQFIELFGSESMNKSLRLRQLRQRGNGPSYLELLILHFVIGKAGESVKIREFFNTGYIGWNHPPLEIIFDKTKRRMICERFEQNDRGL